jgi:hypothetical protein
MKNFSSGIQGVAISPVACSVPFWRKKTYNMEDDETKHQDICMGNKI